MMKKNKCKNIQINIIYRLKKYLYILYIMPYDNEYNKQLARDVDYANRRYIAHCSTTGQGTPDYRASVPGISGSGSGGEALFASGDIGCGGDGILGFQTGSLLGGPKVKEITRRALSSFSSLGATLTTVRDRSDTSKPFVSGTSRVGLPPAAPAAPAPGAPAAPATETAPPVNPPAPETGSGGDGVPGLKPYRAVPGLFSRSRMSSLVSGPVPASGRMYVAGKYATVRDLGDVSSPGAIGGADGCGACCSGCDDGGSCMGSESENESDCGCGSGNDCGCGGNAFERPIGDEKKNNALEIPEETTGEGGRGGVRVRPQRQRQAPQRQQRPQRQQTQQPQQPQQRPQNKQGQQGQQPQQTSAQKNKQRQQQQQQQQTGVSQPRIVRNKSTTKAPTPSGTKSSKPQKDGSVAPVKPVKPKKVDEAPAAPPAPGAPGVKPPGAPTPPGAPGAKPGKVVPPKPAPAKPPNAPPAAPPAKPGAPPAKPGAVPGAPPAIPGQPSWMKNTSAVLDIVQKGIQTIMLGKQAYDLFSETPIDDFVDEYGDEYGDAAGLTIEQLIEMLQAPPNNLEPDEIRDLFKESQGATQVTTGATSGPSASIKVKAKEANIGLKGKTKPPKILKEGDQMCMEPFDAVANIEEGIAKEALPVRKQDNYFGSGGTGVDIALLESNPNITTAVPATKGEQTKVVEKSMMQSSTMSGMGKVKKGRGRPKKMALLQSNPNITNAIPATKGKQTKVVEKSKMQSGTMSGMGKVAKKDAKVSKKGGKEARAAIVKKIMQEKGMKMIEASKYVKANNLY